MTRTPQPVYRPTPPGTSAAVLGAFSVVVGALMVIGGLLLRIEAAILLSGGRSAAPNDDPA
ncbi:hypothetical protein [Micromonospora mirobrigensis]|uniref:hypothetical protein n=1 Tax=Micromonospora mirobrigensis TaxID=262898 RepID=UPI00114CEE43|nr:hypothetical protein [Micromonospora mirobrigensis]